MTATMGLLDAVAAAGVVLVARRRGGRVLMLVAGLDVRIVSEDGELLRTLTLDPSRTYQPLGRR